VLGGLHRLRSSAREEGALRATAKLHGRRVRPTHR
jgi:hypothetical protein